MIAAVLYLGGGAYMRQLDQTARNWFVMTGVIVFLSQMFRYMALAVAPVSVVVPIQRLSVIFRVISGWLVNRDHEVFTTAVISGIALSLVGAIALSLSTDAVLTLLPADWAALLTRSWP